MQIWDYYGGTIYCNNALDEDQEALQMKVKEKNLLEDQDILIIEKVVLSEELNPQMPPFVCNACILGRLNCDEQTSKP